MDGWRDGLLVGGSGCRLLGLWFVEVSLTAFGFLGCLDVWVVRVRISGQGVFAVGAGSSGYRRGDGKRQAR